MSEGKKRKVHTAEFKGKVGLEAVLGVKTISEIAQTYGCIQCWSGSEKRRFLSLPGRCSRPGVAPSQPQTTLLRLARGFAYLVAVIDWYSRKALSCWLSNSMDASFCVDCLEDALREHGRPEVFNSDQGSQFTSVVFTDVLKREGVTISMDGRGRAPPVSE